MPKELRAKAGAAIPSTPGLAAASHDHLIILAKEENRQNQTLGKSACVCHRVPASSSLSPQSPPPKGGWRLG